MTLIADENTVTLCLDRLQKGNSQIFWIIHKYLHNQSVSDVTQAKLEIIFYSCVLSDKHHVITETFLSPHHVTPYICWVHCHFIPYFRTMQCFVYNSVFFLFFFPWLVLYFLYACCTYWILLWSYFYMLLHCMCVYIFCALC